MGMMTFSLMRMREEKAKADKTKQPVNTAEQKTADAIKENAKGEAVSNKPEVKPEQNSGKTEAKSDAKPDSKKQKSLRDA